MLRYLKHHELDQEAWDRCVNESPNGNIYSLSTYLNIVAPAWEGLVIEESKEYLGVMAIPQFKKFNLMRFVREPYWVNQLGLIHRHQRHEIEFENVLQCIFERNSLLVNYPLSIDNLRFLPVLESISERDARCTFQTYHSYHLKLSAQYNQIVDNFADDRKQNLKKAMRNNLSFTETDDLETLIKMFSENIAPRIYGGVLPHQYELLRKLYRDLQAQRLCKIYQVADVTGKPITSSLFYFYKNQVIKFLSAPTTLGRKLHGDTFLMAEVIKRFAGEDRILDFERASSEGINNYKESFGSEKVSYPALTFDNLPWAVRTFKRIRFKLLSKRNQNG
jgi:hypothetical protein